MKKCEFNKAWVGPCDEKTVGETKFCSLHTGVKCCSCGDVAIKECSETMGLVCGAPLCIKCEHTLRENGCNSGAPLPEGMRGHCRKDEQKYEPWYMDKSKIDGV